MEYCISSCYKTASLVPLAQTEEQGTKIISHALLSPLLTSTCFHRQMLMLLLRAITRHQTALQKKKTAGSHCPLLLQYGISSVWWQWLSLVWRAANAASTSTTFEDPDLILLSPADTQPFFQHFLSFFHFLFLFNCASTFSSSLFRSPTHTLTLSHSLLSLLSKWAEALLLWQSP